MKYSSEFRDPVAVKGLVSKIDSMTDRTWRLMEICGGHTMAIRRSGLNRVLSKHVRFLTGPGCPVCVCSLTDISRYISLSERENVCLVSFGDLFRVPGLNGSLMDRKTEGKDVRTVYSVHDALKMAEKEPEKEFVFAGIGFETTVPTVAAAVLEAGQSGIKNFSVYSMHKTMPQAIRTLLSDPDHMIEGFILPGHVSTITGSEMYGFLPDEFSLSGAIAGFEPMDLVLAVYELIKSLESGKPAVQNTYSRVVKVQGNSRAKEMVDQIFKPVDAEWRGIGIIPGSGLNFRDEYGFVDALNRFDFPQFTDTTQNTCQCGEILRGRMDPPDCSLYAKVCTPAHPMGACMVSSEGACAAWYKYGAEK